jgi:hypothetical protein
MLIHVKRYYEEMKKRPSYEMFGVLDSGFATVSAILLVLGKVLFSKVIEKY